MKISSSLQTLVLCKAVSSTLFCVLLSSSTDLSTAFTPMAFYPAETEFSPVEELKELKLCGFEGSEDSNDTDKEKLECLPTKSNNQRVESDPTCMSCLQDSSLSTSEKLWRKYSHQGSRQARLNMFKKHFAKTCAENKDACNKPVVVVAADNKNLPLLQKWWCQAQESGIDKEQLVVYSYSLEVTRWAVHLELYTIQPVFYGIQIPSAGVSDAFKFSLFPLFLDLLHLGKSIMYNDVDVLWKNNVAKTLSTMSSEVDIIGQASDKKDGKHLQASVLFLNSTRGAVSFIHSMLSATPLFLETYGSNGDDALWNTMLAHEKYSSLKWLTLSPPLVVKSSQKDEFVDGETLAIQLDHEWNEIISGTCTAETVSSPLIKTM